MSQKWTAGFEVLANARPRNPIVLIADATRLFARSHRFTLVNLARVEGVQPLSDGSWRPTMRSGPELVVSRTHCDAVLVRLGRALGRPS